MNTNYELNLAYNFINYTNRNVFLTGKAGTGKTTFLHRLRTSAFKRMIVVAPTGVAAINAGGVTIHSFFQMPFGPIIPDSREQEINHRKFTKLKINIIRSMDLLVIDEISMVRADLLDGIDHVLRRFKDRRRPFGGVQLLMIGDLQQLAPVVKHDEWQLLKSHYKSMFFFHSKAYQQSNVLGIELKHIYRQQDKRFISLLNAVRTNTLNQETLSKLNERYHPEFSPKPDEGYIRLTTHNSSADKINNKELDVITKRAHRFIAEVEGIFPEHAYPTQEELTLKVGAQVMFVKNDSSHEKRYYNGKIGRITNIEEGLIEVQCPTDIDPILVDRELWNNVKYTIDPETKDIKEELVGSFLQYPLRLAWAITIHKSQGLTFEKAIIDAQAAFAHGQTYVALSRCKTLEGMVLSSKISLKAVISDQQVDGFTRHVEENEPDDKVLHSSKKDYQLSLLQELFRFHQLMYQYSKCEEIINENDSTIMGNLPEVIQQGRTYIKDELLPVGEKFLLIIQSQMRNIDDIEEHQPLQERLIKSSEYYLKNMDMHLMEPLTSSSFETDNYGLEKDIRERLRKIKEISSLKISCFTSCKKGFIVKDYLSTRAKALIRQDEKKDKKQRATKGEVQTNYPQLYKRIQDWRLTTAEEKNLILSQIVTQKVIVQLANTLPLNLKELKDIPGVGKKTLKNYGKEIIAIIHQFCKDSNIPVNIEEDQELELVPKKNSKQRTFEMFKQGLNINDIAKERELAKATIEGHLAYFVGTGDLDVSLFVDKDLISPITKFFKQFPDSGLRDAKDYLSDDITFSDILFVRKMMYHEEKEQIKS
ncbi:helicase [Puteibacter caeruleilacunae]|nr:helicase [Puteibacter caeruleilacunae]